MKAFRWKSGVFGFLVLTGFAPPWAFAQRVSVSDEIVEIRARYPRLAVDELQREKYIVGLIALRERLVPKLEAANRDEWYLIDREVGAHPAPVPSDPAVFPRALAGYWRSPRHDYLYRPDGTWTMLPADPGATHGTWKIEGNRIIEAYLPGLPAKAHTETIVLLDEHYFVFGNEKGTYIEKRLPGPPVSP